SIIVKADTGYGALSICGFSFSHSNVPFPLTPALSPGERENRRPPFDKGGLFETSRCRKCCPLSPGERAGARGKGMCDKLRLPLVRCESICDPEKSSGIRASIFAVFIAPPAARGERGQS